MRSLLDMKSVLHLMATVQNFSYEITFMKSFHGLFNFMKGEYILNMSFWKM